MGMKRISKLIRIGNTSLGVIIPKGYLDYNKLKPGDKVEVISTDIVTVKPLKEGG